ncbi:PREDICTED: uncharacterized protein LOC109153517 [Ipomoea nil]|uniref:uncharacterized protein LOC109153517 n=1 Tax=Ipomoea nil TaxID=35883 RepID=UPI0009014464|nr:PREDICTED: uncharacterized protein LOC109153517 [Ipomoea nil]
MASSSKHHMDLGEEYSALSLGDDEEEFDDEFPIAEGAAADIEIETPFILVGKLLSEKPTRFNFLKDTMASIWKPKKGMMAREVSTNLFLFFFVNELDIRKVLDDGPWSYDENLLLLKRIESNIPPHRVQLIAADFWVQAYNIPTNMQTYKTAEMIGSSLGSFIKADDIVDNNPDGLSTSFMRVRVQLDTSKPLTKKMKIKPATGEPFYIEFKYEKLPTFCFICGLIGHNNRSCGKLFEGSVEDYGPELRAIGL